MTFTDPIGDMFSRIRNGQLRSLNSVVIPSSNFRKNILDILKNEGYIKDYFINRDILICREISKIYEEYSRYTIDELKIFETTPKGELTIVISEKKIDKKTSHFLNESDKKNIHKMINKLSIKEIVNLISQNNKISKKKIYNYCLQIKKNEN